jgi:hypothetical protein
MKKLDILLEEITQVKELIKGHHSDIPLIELDLLQQKTIQLYDEILKIKREGFQETLTEKKEFEEYNQTDPTKFELEEDVTEVISVTTHTEEVKENKMPETPESEEKKTEHRDRITISEEKQLEKEDSVSILLKGLEGKKEEKKPLIQKFTKEDHSLNTKIAQNKTQQALADTINKGPINDIKTAISLNLKLSMIKDLFNSNQKEYKKFIDFVNKCDNYSEAKFFIRKEADKKTHWDNHKELIDEFMELVGRKFS